MSKLFRVTEKFVRGTFWCFKVSGIEKKLYIRDGYQDLWTKLKAPSSVCKHLPILVIDCTCMLQNNMPGRS